MHLNKHIKERWGVLQYVAVYCSVLQYVAMRCSVLQCAAVCCSVMHVNRRIKERWFSAYPQTWKSDVYECQQAHQGVLYMNVNTHVIQRCSVLQSTLISYSYSDVHWSHEIQCVAACFAVCCCVAACFAVCCSSFGNHPKKKPPPPWGGSPTITPCQHACQQRVKPPLFRGAIFLQALHLESTSKGNPPGGVFPTINMHVNKRITQR